MSSPHVLIGLTGGIGAGKSTVAKTMVDLGAHLVDADAIQRLVVAKGSEGLAQIVATFGTSMLTADGELNRPKMAALVFSDAEARKQLEAITHPMIQAETVRQMAQARPGQPIVHDIPLLVELNRADEYDLVVVVDAPLDARLARLVRDRRMSEDEARKRIASQATTAQRRAVADVWLTNDATTDVLIERVREMWNSHVVPGLHEAKAT